MIDDPVKDIVAVVRDTMAVYFHPSQAPLGGGTNTVRILTGDVVPLSLWNAHTQEGQNCGEPFVWVRMMQRFRSSQFPAPGIDTSPCQGTRVVALEVGVGRCATLSVDIDWKALNDEAAVSLEDSARIEAVLCHAAAVLRREHTSEVGTDTLNPYGPEGGVTAWTGIIYVSY